MGETRGIRLSPRRLVAPFVVAIVALLVAVPALADPPAPGPSPDPAPAATETTTSTPTATTTPKVVAVKPKTVTTHTSTTTHHTTVRATHTTQTTRHTSKPSTATTVKHTTRVVSKPVTRPVVKHPAVKPRVVHKPKPSAVQPSAVKPVQTAPSVATATQAVPASAGLSDTASGGGSASGFARMLLLVTAIVLLALSFVPSYVVMDYSGLAPRRAIAIRKGLAVSGLSVGAAAAFTLLLNMTP